MENRDFLPIIWNFKKECLSLSTKRRETMNTTISIPTAEYDRARTFAKEQNLSYKSNDFISIVQIIKEGNHFNIQMI